MNEELLGTLVRDMTKAGSIPKSEARRRIGEIVSDSNQQLLERLSEKLENGFDEYMIKKSGVKALIQEEKERLCN